MKKIGYPIILAVCAGLCACSNTQQTSPISDYSTTSGSFSPSVEPIGSNVIHYTVQPHDTLYQISRRSGHKVNDLVQWNNLSDANDLKVGQVLRVQPPENATVQSSPVPVATSQVSRSSENSTVANSKQSSTSNSVAKTKQPVEKTEVVGGIREVSNISWDWPTKGTLLSSFGAGKNRGIDISGSKGQKVYSAADGVILHKGNMNGYGNLVIVRHTDNVLSAYAHNNRILVKEKQKVTRGQAIAEMGNTDSDRVKLHFEIRYQGKPVDPVKYLPKR